MSDLHSYRAYYRNSIGNVYVEDFKARSIYACMFDICKKNLDGFDLISVWEDTTILDDANE